MESGSGATLLTTGANTFDSVANQVDDPSIFGELLIQETLEILTNSTPAGTRQAWTDTCNTAHVPLKIPAPFLKLLLTLATIVSVGCATSAVTAPDAEPDVVDAIDTFDAVNGDTSEVDPTTFLIDIYGSEGRQYATTVLESDDGGVYLGGYHVRLAQDDGTGWLAMLDPEGHPRWELLIGRWVSGLAPHPDGVVVVGRVRDGDRSTGLVARISDDGETLWTLEWHTDFDSPSRIEAVQVTPDGTYIIVGSMQPNNGEPCTWLAEVSADGALTWQRALLDIEIDRAALAITGSDDILLAARTRTDEAWLIRLDRHGIPLWARRIGLDSSMNDKIDVVETIDGDIVLASNDAFHFSSAGTLRWMRGFSPVLVTVAQASPDGSSVLAGYTTTGEGLDLVVFGIDPSGEPTWGRTMAREGCEAPYGAVRARDGNVIIATGGCEHAMVLKIGSDGRIECDEVLPSMVSGIPVEAAIEEVEVVVEDTDVRSEIVELEVESTASWLQVVCESEVE